MQFYLNPAREQESNSLPDGETFLSSQEWISSRSRNVLDGDLEDRITGPGWYWHQRRPGCSPDAYPNGPFDTETLAIADAQGGVA